MVHVDHRVQQTGSYDVSPLIRCNIAKLFTNYTTLKTSSVITKRPTSTVDLRADIPAVGLKTSGSFMPTRKCFPPQDGEMWLKMTELFYSLCQERDLPTVALWGGHLMIWRVTLKILLRSFQENAGTVRKNTVDSKKFVQLIIIEAALNT